MIQLDRQPWRPPKIRRNGTLVVQLTQWVACFSASLPTDAIPTYIDSIESTQYASLRGWLPPATLPHNERIEQNNVKEAGRGPEVGANWRHANAKSFLAPGKQSGRRMHASYKYVRKETKECCVVLTLKNNGKPFAHHRPTARGCIFLGAGRFRFLRCRALIGTYVFRCFVHGWLRCAMQWWMLDDNMLALGAGCAFSWFERKKVKKKRVRNSFILVGIKNSPQKTHIHFGKEREKKQKNEKKT